VFLCTILALCVIVVVSCGEEGGKEEGDAPAASTVSSAEPGIAVAASNPALMVLVQYNSGPYRLKVVTETEYETNLDQKRYVYIGRAYASEHDDDGFTVPVYEYFIPMESQYPTVGYHYSLGEPCDPTTQSTVCPSYAYQGSPIVAYVSSAPDASRGVVHVYQYPGLSLYNGKSTSPTFTIDTVEGWFDTIPSENKKIIGYIYHGTQEDCNATPRRTPFCDPVPDDSNLYDF